MAPHPYTTEHLEYMFYMIISLNLNEPCKVTISSSFLIDCIPLTEVWSLLPAATKLDQGNIFTSLHLSTGGRGICLSACWDTPREQTPAPSRPPWEQTPPRTRHTPPRSRPPEQTPPGADTPQTRHTPPEQTPQTSHTSPTRHPPPQRKQTAAYG